MGLFLIRESQSNRVRLYFLLPLRQSRVTAQASNCSMVLGGVTGRKAWPFWATIIRYHNSHSFAGCLMHSLLKIQNIVGKKEYKLKWLGLALARPQGCTHNFTSGCKQQELLTCTHWGARSVLHCSPGVRRYFLYVAQSLLPSSAGEEEKQRSVWPQPCFGAFQRVTTAANCPQLQRWCDNQKKRSWEWIMTL